MHPKLNHHFFDHHRGSAAPPTPPLSCRMFTEINAPFVESSLLRTSWGGGPLAFRTPLTGLNGLFVESSLSQCVFLSSFVSLSLFVSPFFCMFISLYRSVSFSEPLSLFLSLSLSLSLSLIICIFLFIACESAAPAAKSVPYLARVLRLPQSLALRKCCTHLCPQIGNFCPDSKYPLF